MTVPEWCSDSMKFAFLYPGKTREKYLNDGIRDYAERLSRFVQVEFIITKTSGGNTRELQKKQESDRLLEKCGDASMLVVLDPAGVEIDSEDLARRLSGWVDRGLRDIYFVLGGHYGLHDDILRRADLVLSLSRMTFTHEMSRLILLEQLYRCCMINAGRSYHY
jgi:23S rRNA (pseudouridine1915-N3)-methyltransferase